MSDRGWHLFDELTREQLHALAPASVAVLPVGSTEQHGPHLPTGTDFIHTQWVAHTAADKASSQVSTVVTPTLPFGCSQYHLPFGGTISLSTSTFYDVMYQLVESLVTDGFRRIFIVNGHGGNHELVGLVARDIAIRYPVDVAAGSWWLVAWDVLVAAGAHTIGQLPGHAGAFETSLVMALRPDLVSTPRPKRTFSGDTDPTRFGDLLRTERHESWQAIEGFTDNPDLCDPELGRRCLEAAATELARRLIEFAGPVERAGHVS